MFFAFSTRQAELEQIMHFTGINYGENPRQNLLTIIP